MPVSDHPLSGLKAARIRSGTDVNLLADRLGVSLTTYYRYENGTRRLYFDKACALADILGVSLDELRRDPAAPAESDGTVVAALADWDAGA